VADFLSAYYLPATECTSGAVRQPVNQAVISVTKLFSVYHIKTYCFEYILQPRRLQLCPSRGKFERSVTHMYMSTYVRRFKSAPPPPPPSREQTPQNTRIGLLYILPCLKNILRPICTDSRLSYLQNCLRLYAQSVATDTDWTVGVQFSAEAKRFFSIHQGPDRFWSPSSLLYNGYWGLFLWGVKRSGREANHLSLSSAEAKYGGAIPPLHHTSSWHELS
jgi:hypothetical protein